MKQNTDEDGSKPVFNSFRAGIIALVFMLLGFQLALFIHKAAQTRILANRDCPDTVYVERLPAPSDAEPSGNTSRRGGSSEYGRTSGGSSEYARTSGGSSEYARTSGGSSEYARTERHNASHAPAVEAIRRNTAPRKVENFRFNPNTASTDDLVRLGFSPKQAESIDNYRRKGGRFRRSEDFRKSYVVSDSVYKRLEPYIDIPLIDINTADSAAFETLPGIGAYFASKMVSYRERLGGYSCKEQLMEIYHFDREKFDGLKDLITVSRCEPFRLWTLPADSLRLHPHIRDWRVARSIVLYRENNPRELLTIDGLEAAGVLDSESAAKLRRCRIALPQQ